MALWTDYEEKRPPEDEDELMILDRAGNVNRRTVFSGVWDWIVTKFKERTIDDLPTEDKTVTGAINELHTKKATGEGIALSITDSGNLKVTYDDGQEE